MALFFRVSVDEVIGNEKAKYIENSPVADEIVERMGYGSLFLLTFVLLLLEVCTGKDYLVPESARRVLIAELVFLLALYGLGIRLSIQKRMNPKIIGAVLLLQFLFPGIQKVWEYCILWKEKQIETGLWIERSVICLLLWSVPGFLISRFFLPEVRGSKWTENRNRLIYGMLSLLCADFLFVPWTGADRTVCL